MTKTAEKSEHAYHAASYYAYDAPKRFWLEVCLWYHQYCCWFATHLMAKIAADKEYVYMIPKNAEWLPTRIAFMMPQTSERPQTAADSKRAPTHKCWMRRPRIRIWDAAHNASHSSIWEEFFLATMVPAQAGVFLPWANPGAGWRPVKALPNSLCSDRSHPGRRGESSGAYRSTRCDGCTATVGYSETSRDDDPSPR